LPQPDTDVSLCVVLVTPTLSVAVALPVSAGSVESPHSTVASLGQLITGSSLSLSSMFCGQLALLPHESVAVQVRVMSVPVSVSLCVTVGLESQASAAVAVPVFVGLVEFPVSNDTSAGQVIDGALLSVVVMV
jgi:hypothetical protein